MQHHLHFPFHHHKPHAARYDVDMTQGSTTGHLIRFALPLLAGNLFQQLYNQVSTMLYSCWNRLPASSGRAKLMRCRVVLPCVMSTS